MKKQKENSHEGITWSEMGKQNVQAKEVCCLNWKIYCDITLHIKICVINNYCTVFALFYFVCEGNFQV